MSKALLLTLLVALASGCVSTEMGRLQRDIAHDLEAGGQAEVGRGFSMAFGRGSIGTTRFLGRLVAPSSTEPYRRLSRHVRRVKVARYPIVGTVDATLIDRPDALDRYSEDGWYPMVTVRDQDSRVWVLVREDEDMVLTDLLSIVVSGQDLVLTRVSGDLSGLVLDAGAMASGDLFGGALDGMGVFETDEESTDG